MTTTSRLQNFENRRMDDDEWRSVYSRSFFQCCGYHGGASRSKKKLDAARKNLALANAARLAVKARREQEAVGASAQAPAPASPPTDH